MTIGMNNLGKNGRLGNQMFQYAALVGIAKQSGYDFEFQVTVIWSEDLVCYIVARDLE